MTFHDYKPNLLPRITLITHYTTLSAEIQHSLGFFFFFFFCGVYTKVIGVYKSCLTSEIILPQVCGLFALSSISFKSYPLRYAKKLSLIKVKGKRHGSNCSWLSLCFTAKWTNCFSLLTGFMVHRRFKRYPRMVTGHHHANVKTEPQECTGRGLLREGWPCSLQEEHAPKSQTRLMATAPAVWVPQEFQEQRTKERGSQTASDSPAPSKTIVEFLADLPENNLPLQRWEDTLSSMSKLRQTWKKKQKFCFGNFIDSELCL